jgi:phage baseplate assembly protein W
MAKGIASQFIRGANDVSTLEGRNLIADHVRQVVMTRAGDDRSNGELPWLQKFGSRIDRLRHRGIDSKSLGLARSLTLTAVQTWVPEVRVLTVTAVQDSVDEKAIRIRVQYQVIETGIVDSIDAGVSTLS